MASFTFDRQTLIRAEYNLLWRISNEESLLGELDKDSIEDTVFLVFVRLCQAKWMLARQAQQLVVKRLQDQISSATQNRVGRKPFYALSKQYATALHCLAYLCIFYCSMSLDDEGRVLNEELEKIRSCLFSCSIVEEALNTVHNLDASCECLTCWMGSPIMIAAFRPKSVAVRAVSPTSTATRPRVETESTLPSLSPHPSPREDSTELSILGSRAKHYQPADVDQNNGKRQPPQSSIDFKTTVSPSGVPVGKDDDNVRAGLRLASMTMAQKDSLLSQAASQERVTSRPERRQESTLPTAHPSTSDRKLDLGQHFQTLMPPPSLMRYIEHNLLDTAWQYMPPFSSEMFDKDICK